LSIGSKFANILNRETNVVAALFLAIGLFSVAFLANESPPSQSPIGTVAWSTFVSILASGAFIGTWLIARRIWALLGRLILPGYLAFAFYSYLQLMTHGAITFGFIRYRLFMSDRLFLPLLLIATVLVYYGLSRFITWNNRLVRYVMFIVLALAIWNFAIWGVGQGRSYEFTSERSTAGVVLEKSGELFPIYWFMFDGYARADVLANEFEFDNSPFVEALESLNFDVNNNATTSFMNTLYVIPGEMELENIGTLDENSAESLWADRTSEHWRFEESALANLLAEIGYRSFEFSSEWSSSIFTRTFPVSFYESTGLKTIPIALQPWRSSIGTGGVGMVENLAKTAALSTEQDVLVFSYNFQPHPPYFFDSNGTIAGTGSVQSSTTLRQADWQRKDAFVAQTEFVNAQILRTIGKILSQSQMDPLIIIQSDHGPASNWTAKGGLSSYPNEDLFYERTSILSAVHLPTSCDKSEFERSDSSVNTFSLVLNSCFGTDMPVHPNDVYWGYMGSWTVFEDRVWVEDS
jgi:hypothetical protein